jgi:hypothetical protein
VASDLQSRLPKMGDATWHEQLIERRLVKDSKWRCRPNADILSSSFHLFEIPGFQVPSTVPDPPTLSRGLARAPFKSRR